MQMIAKPTRKDRMISIGEATSCGGVPVFRVNAALKATKTLTSDPAPDTLHYKVS